VAARGRATEVILDLWCCRRRRPQAGHQHRRRVLRGYM